MKKFLSLVLALVMTMSLVTVAGASFTDAADVNYDEAVDVISALEIVGGYADGSFNPEGTLTRGAAAKIICNILVGPETASSLVANTAPFSDVPVNHTFAGYIAYCVNEGIISGYADGTFRPAATLTGYAFMKMLLGAIGYDAAIEKYTGTNWAINVAEDVVSAKLAKGLDGKFNGNKALTREEACLYAFNALNAGVATYSSKGDNLVIGDISINLGASQVSVSETTLLRHNKFEDLTANSKTEDKPDDTTGTDAMGRPAHTWYLDGEEIGTYADTADYVIENELDAEDFTDLLEDLDVTADEKVVKAADTANGAVIELFFDEDGEKVEKAVKIEAVLLKAGKVQKDLVSTKDEDDRYVTFSGKKVVADSDVKTSKGGVEIDNFEAVYEAADDDKDQQFLVIFDKTTEKKVFSVEIPETVEAKISRVKGDEIVAGGETYKLADTVALTASEKVVTSKDEVELIVGANGCVYAIDYTGADTESDIIYLDTMLKADTDKYGKTTYKAQIVNEENEIAELVVDKAYTKEVDGKTVTDSGFYTYVETDDEGVYKLTKADAEDDFYTLSVAVEDDETYVKNGDKKVYFAADMTVVYIADTGADLEVTVKEGAQNIKATAAYVLNADDDIAVLYVLAAYEAGVSEDVIFLPDVSDPADVRDYEGDPALAYTAYIDGEELELMIKVGEKQGAGFWTYEYDEDTGVYTLVKDQGVYGVVKAGENEGTVIITKDKYVSVGDIDDAVVTGEIIDLTDEGLYTLADISDWDGKDLKVSFTYDEDENEITALFVDFA